MKPGKVFRQERRLITKEIFQRANDIVRAMQHALVKILTGTDTGDPYTYPGSTLHEELELLGASRIDADGSVASSNE